MRGLSGSVWSYFYEVSQQIDGILVCNLHKYLLKYQFCVLMPTGNAGCISGVRSSAKIDLENSVWSSGSWPWLHTGCGELSKAPLPGSLPRGSNVGSGLSFGTLKSSVGLDAKPRLRITPTE